MNSMLFLAAFLTLTTFAVEFTKSFGENGECRCLGLDTDPKYKNSEDNEEGTSCENPHNEDNPGARFCYVNGPACADQDITSFKSKADVFADYEFEVHYSYQICTKSAEDTIEELQEKAQGFEAVANEWQQKYEEAQSFEAAATELEQKYNDLTAEFEELKKQSEDKDNKLAEQEDAIRKYEEEEIPTCYKMAKVLKKKLKELKKTDGDSSDEENQ